MPFVRIDHPAGRDPGDRTADRGVRAATSAVFLVSVLSFLQACAGVDGNARDAPTITALTAQADAWDRAIVRKDRAAIVANMADDFRQIGSTGQVSDKATFVESLVSPDLQIDPYTVEDFDVRIYGDIALLSGTTRMTGRDEGQPFRTHYRYIDIYVRREGRWRIVSVQTTRIAD